MQYLLVIFGVFVMIVSTLLIIVPYVRRKADLLCPWALFHLSCLNYLGLASILTGTSWTHLYVIPRDEDYITYVTGGMVFYLAVILFYYAFSYPDRVAARVMTKVAPRTPKAMLFLLPVCFLLSMGYLYVPDIQVLGQWMLVFGRSGFIFGAVFAIFAWVQRPLNTVLLFVVGFFLLVAVIVSNRDYGRRDFLGVLMVIPICWYYLRGRYYNPARVFMIATVFAVIAGAALSGVSMIRSMRQDPDRTLVEAIWEKVKAIPDAFQITGSTDALWQTDTGDAALAAIRLYDYVQPPQPFFVEEYILVHPIPRIWWPEKPDGLGATLPIDTGWVRTHGAVNIGPGVIGHGYQEGGVAFLLVYALWVSFGLRFFDRLLRRDPTNPYLLAIYAGCSGELIGWCRGDIGLFTSMILGTYFTGFVINYLARAKFGTDHIESLSQPFVEETYGASEPVAASWQQQY